MATRLTHCVPSPPLSKFMDLPLAKNILTVLFNDMIRVKSLFGVSSTKFICTNPKTAMLLLLQLLSMVDGVF